MISKTSLNSKDQSKLFAPLYKCNPYSYYSANPRGDVIEKIDQVQYLFHLESYVAENSDVEQWQYHEGGVDPCVIA